MYVPDFLRGRYNREMDFNVKSSVRVFDGVLTRFTHFSSSTSTTMTCAVYIPATTSTSISYILYLSGLTCTDENVCQKGGVFRSLAENGIALVCPDTSPRGANIPGEAVSWDFGVGAGFYVDATQEPWSQNFRMYSYITAELPLVLSQHFPSLNHSK